MFGLSVSMWVSVGQQTLPQSRRQNQMVHSMRRREGAEAVAGTAAGSRGAYPGRIHRQVTLDGILWSETV